MFSLEEKIDQSTLYKTLTKLLDLIYQNEQLIKNLKANEKSYVDWMSYVAEYMKYVLDNTDPALVTRQAMKETEPEITNSYNQLRGYFSTKNTTNLTASYTSMENVLNIFPKINHVTNKNSINGIKTAATSLRRNIKVNLEEFENDFKDTSKSFDVLKEEINQYQVKLDQQKDKLIDLSGEFRNSFKELENEYRQSLENKLTDNDLELKKMMSAVVENNSVAIRELKSELNKMVEEDFKKLNILLGQLEAEKNKAEKLVGELGMAVLAEGYSKEAVEEKKQADKWRWGAIISLLFSFGAILYFLNTYTGEQDLQAFLARSVILGLGITGFTYCARQSSQHRTAERESKKIQLQLSSLDPYLKELDELDRKKLKRELASRFFGDTTQIQKPENIAETPVEDGKESTN